MTARRLPRFSALCGVAGRPRLRAIATVPSVSAVLKPIAVSCLLAALLLPMSAAPARAADIGPGLRFDGNDFFDEGRPAARRYEWQFRHPWLRRLPFGVQGFGLQGVSEPSHIDAFGSAELPPSHRAGPAVFGEMSLDLDHDSSTRNTLLYQAAYLLGTAYRQRDSGTFTLQLQYAF